MSHVEKFSQLISANRTEFHPPTNPAALLVIERRRLHLPGRASLYGISQS